MTASSSGPAYRIHTPRLVLRCWNPTDAPRLLQAVTESLDHLRPWMPWAKSEPESLDAKVLRLRRMRGEFDLGQNFVYGIFDRESRQVLGGTGLHPRAGEGAREIGYWIHVSHVGQGYATEAAAALTRVAFEVDGVERVEIRCDPANVRSAAIPARLGFVHEATLRKRLRDGDDPPRDVMVWTMLREEYASGAAAAAALEAFDALGRRIL